MKEKSAHQQKAKAESVHPGITTEYVKTLTSACRLHRPCASLADQLGHWVSAMSDRGIRCPNDWEFTYTGVIELRWYDGVGDSFSGSKSFVALQIGRDSASITGRIQDQTRGYSSDQGLRIPFGPKGTIDAVLTVFAVLVQLVDEEKL